MRIRPSRLFNQNTREQAADHYAEYLPDIATLRRHFITFHISYEREITTYGHPPRALSIKTHESFSGVVLGKLVDNPENGAGPVFQNALPETVMDVLQNGPGPFQRSLCPFSKTTPTRFGGRSGRSTKRPPPVLAVVLAVLENDPHPF